MASWRGLGRGLTAASQALTGLPGIFAELGKEERADRIRAEDRAERGFQRLSELKGDVHNDIAQGNPLSQVLAEASEIIERSGLATTDDETQKLLDDVTESYRGAGELFKTSQISATRRGLAESPDRWAYQRRLGSIPQDRRDLATQLGEDPDEAFAVPEFEEVEPITEITRVPVDPPEEEGGQIGDPSWTGGTVEAEFDLRGAEAGLNEELQRKQPQLGGLTLAEADVYLEPFKGTMAGVEGSFRAKEEHDLSEEERLRAQRREDAVWGMDEEEKRKARVLLGHDKDGEPIFLPSWQFGIINNMDPQLQYRLFDELTSYTPDIEAAARERNVELVPGQPEVFTELFSAEASRNRVLDAFNKAGISAEDQQEALGSIATRGTADEIFAKYVNETYGNYRNRLVGDFTSAVNQLRLKLGTDAITYAPQAGSLLAPGGGRGTQQTLDLGSIAAIQWNTSVLTTLLLMGVKAEAVSLYGEKRGLEIAHAAFFSLDKETQKIIDAEDNAGVWGSLDTRWILEGAHEPDNVWVRSEDYGRPGTLPEGQYVLRPSDKRGDPTEEELKTISAKPEVVTFIEGSNVQTLRPQLLQRNPYVAQIAADEAAGVSSEGARQRSEDWSRAQYGAESANQVPLIDSPESDLSVRIDAILEGERSYRDSLIARQKLYAPPVPLPPMQGKSEQAGIAAEALIRSTGSYGNPIDPNAEGLTRDQQEIVQLQKDGIERYLEAEKQILSFLNSRARQAPTEMADAWAQALNDPNLSWPMGQPPADFQYARQALLELQSHLMVYMPNMEREIPLSQFNPMGR